MSLKIGLISYGANVCYCDIPQKYLDITENLLRLSHNEVIASKLILTQEDNDMAIEIMKRERVDLLVVQLGSFGQGSSFVKMITELRELPLFVWGFNDPIVPDFPTIPMNSLTGLTMLTSFLNRMEKKFDYFYGDFCEDTLPEKLMDTVAALDIRKQLREAKYAVVGSRVPGFYLSMVDELRFRKQIGPEIVYYSLASLIDEASKLNSLEVESEINNIYKTRKVSLGREIIEKNVRLELALKNYIKRNNISAITLKCWPELQQICGVSGCGILSHLNDSGITASCEGDVTGLASMDILHRITRKTVFFADLVAAPKGKYLKAWHCGIGPESLASPNSQVEYTHQSTMRNGIGIAIQYEMQLGRVTICKLSENKENYRMLVTGGQTVNPDRTLLGVQTDIQLDVGFDQLLSTIVENGFEQHYAIVHSDARNILRALTRWMDIALYEL